MRAMQPVRARKPVEDAWGTNKKTDGPQSGRRGPTSLSVEAGLSTQNGRSG
jgi:hypothetical protein